MDGVSPDIMTAEHRMVSEQSVYLDYFHRSQCRDPVVIPAEAPGVFGSSGRGGVPGSENVYVCLIWPLWVPGF